MSSYDALAASYDGLMADGVYRRRADYLEKLFQKSRIPVHTVLDLACGTGTCATVAALTELGICPAGEDIHVQLRGGVLTIRVLPGRQLLMTGAAETVCEGTTEV